MTDRSLTWKEVAEFVDAKMFSQSLCEDWKAKFEKDPVSMARAIVGRTRFSRNALIASGIVFLLGLSMVIVTPVVGVVGMGVGIVPAFWFLYQQGESASFMALYPDMDFWRTFPGDVSCFAEWINRSPAALYLLSRTKQRALAKELLVHQASRVISLEKENEQVPPELWSDEKKTLTDDFVWKYNTLFRLSLVEDMGYGPYYREAHKLLG